MNFFQKFWSIIHSYKVNINFYMVLKKCYSCEWICNKFCKTCQNDFRRRFASLWANCLFCFVWMGPELWDPGMDRPARGSAGVFSKWSLDKWTMHKYNLSFWIRTSVVKPLVVYWSWHSPSKPIYWVRILCSANALSQKHWSVPSCELSTRCVPFRNDWDFQLEFKVHLTDYRGYWLTPSDGARQDT